jgi:hypothetical protein
MPRFNLWSDTFVTCANNIAVSERKVRRWGWTLLVLACAVGAVPASADVVYSNFGSGGSFDPGSAYNIGPVYIYNQVIAESFETTSAVQFEDAQLALYSTSGTTADVYLESSASGGPGSVLDTLVEQSSVLTYPGSIITYDCSACATLSADTEYWIVTAVGNGDTQWSFNNIGDNSGIDYDYSGSITGPWTADGSNTRGAFEVDGTPIAAAPEPGTFGLTGLALAGLMLVARRRNSGTAATLHNV